MINKGDIVTRKSYNHDLMFRVIDIINGKDDQKTYAILHGDDMRLVADSPIQDLVKVDERDYKKRVKEIKEKENRSYQLFRQDYNLIRQKNEYRASQGYNKQFSYFQLPGKVLHIDGDPIYLKKCSVMYQRLGIPTYGVHMNEKEMPYQVGALIERVQPDILVITGHDAYLKSKGRITDIQAYRNSEKFVDAVREARKKVPHLDQLVIFAGACQSHFESLIKAGANFASSPTRVNIHALDPVYIVAKISYTSFSEHVNVWDVIRNTLTGEKGLGGIETKGCLRTGMPYSSHHDE